MFKILVTCIGSLLFLNQVACQCFPEGATEASFPMKAGQHIDAGHLAIKLEDEGETLAVTYNAENGFEFVEVQLWVGMDLAQMPQNKQGSPKIGNFPLKAEELTATTTYSFRIPLEGLFECAQPQPDSLIKIAAHATVSKDGGTETAWSVGTRFVEKGMWGMYSEQILTCDCLEPTTTPPPQDALLSSCETAFGRSSDKSQCFLDIDADGDGKGDFSRWGWTNGPLKPGVHTMEIYAGAGQCSLTKGTHVGTLSVTYDGSVADVIYTTFAGVSIKETQLYVGNDLLPKDRKGEFTVAPGQYDEIHDGLGAVTSDSYSMTGLSGDVYVTAHATVCPDGAGSSGDTDPSGGDTDPSGGDTDPSGGDTDPSGGDTDPSGGDTDPSGGDTDPSGGDTDPSGGDTDPSGGDSEPDGDESNAPAGTESCETAFAYDSTTNQCFLDIDVDGDGKGDFSRWGWTNGPLTQGEYTMDIYAGAGQCSLDKGTRVGSLTVNYEGDKAFVWYDMLDGFTMQETQLYVGNDILASDGNGQFTVAPGQYDEIHDGLGEAVKDTYTSRGLSGSIHVVAHATVCGSYGASSGPEPETPNNGDGNQDQEDSPPESEDPEADGSEDPATEGSEGAAPTTSSGPCFPEGATDASFPMKAGQHIDSGHLAVELEDDGATLAVTYNAENGFEFIEVQLWVGMDLAQMPQNKQGSPKIGNFPHKAEELTATTSYTFRIPLQGIYECEQPQPDSAIKIAAHATVSKDGGTETAWSVGTRFVEKGMWGMYSEQTLTCDCGEPEVTTEAPPSGGGCETAFARSSTDSECFLDIDADGDGRGDFNRWGWTNGPLKPGVYSMEIYGGAGQCSLTKGTHVGTMSVNYDGVTANVIYTTFEGFTIKETQLYVGNDILPKDGKGQFTVAPGQYDEIHDGLGAVTSDSYAMNDVSGDVYVVAHATVCGNY